MPVAQVVEIAVGPGKCSVDLIDLPRMIWQKHVPSVKGSRAWPDEARNDAIAPLPPPHQHAAGLERRKPFGLGDEFAERIAPDPNPHLEEQPEQRGCGVICVVVHLGRMRFAPSTNSKVASDQFPDLRAPGARTSIALRTNSSDTS